MARVERFDHVGVTVDDLEAVTAFFLNLGLEQEGQSQIVEGDWVDRVVGLNDVRVEVVMLRAPDGGTKLELSKFHRPVDERGPQSAPANQLGLCNVAFAVDDIKRSLIDCTRTVSTWSARSGCTRTRTGCATCGAPRESSSHWPSRSHDGRCRSAATLVDLLNP